MRPRLISRGNSPGDRAERHLQPGFNEAPADQPGKYPVFRILRAPKFRFNEAPADQPGKWQIGVYLTFFVTLASIRPRLISRGNPDAASCGPEVGGFNEAPADQPGK